MKTNNLATKLTEIESLIQSLSNTDGNTPLKEVQPQLTQVKTLINAVRGLQTSGLELCHLKSQTQEICTQSIVITDADGNIQWVNPAFTSIFGYSAEEVIGKNPRLLKSGQPDQAFYKMWDTIKAGKIWHEEIIIDITERKQAKQELAQLDQELKDKVQQRTEELQIINEELQYIAQVLKASRASFQSIVDKNASGIMVVDDKGIIQFVNPAMQSQFRHHHLAVGNEFAILTSPGKRTEVKITLSENEIGTAEMDVVDTLWEGQPAFLLMLHDITETKKAHAALEEERASLAGRVEERTAELSLANAQLARAARLKDEFIANMSHELRTPLNAILSMSELLTDGFYGKINEKQLKAVGYIETGGRHLLSLITDILDLSKIEAGKMKLEPESIILEGVCHACVHMIKQIAMKKQVSVVFASDENVKTIFADERALKQEQCG